MFSLSLEDEHRQTADSRERRQRSGSAKSGSCTDRLIRQESCPEQGLSVGQAFSRRDLFSTLFPVGKALFRIKHARPSRFDDNQIWREICSYATSPQQAKRGRAELISLRGADISRGTSSVGQLRQSPGHYGSVALAADFYELGEAKGVS